jgi:ribosomal protein S12 methylthiotransferase accessory factor
VVDPLTLCLPAGSKVGADTELEWVEARRYPTGEVVLVPIDVVAVSPGGDLSPGYEPFTTLIGNGLGAGPSLEFALAHGIGELLQRDGNGLAIRALATDVVVDLEGVEDPAAAELLERIRVAGVEPLVKFCGDEFGVANVYAVGDDRGDGGTALPLMMAGAGEAAHPDGGRAVRKALLEFAAARARLAFTHGPWELVRRVAPAEYLELFRPRHSFADEEDRALEAMLGWMRLDRTGMRALLEERVFARGSTKPFGKLPRWQAPAEADGGVPGKALCDELTGRLTAAGLDVLYVDHSPEDAAERGVHVVKAIVPGLEVETMSYHRIGERNARRLLERGSDMVGRGEPPAGALPVRLTAEAEARLGGPVWLDPAAVDRVVGDLYPLYREPEYHSAQVALDARR